MSVLCDYDRLGWQFLSRVMDENNVRLSRTRMGLCDTSTSPLKQPLLFSGDELRLRMLRNERRIHQFLFQSRHNPPPCDAQAVEDLLLGIADMTNQGLLPGGRFRAWCIEAREKSPSQDATASMPPAKVPPEQLPGAVAAFARSVYQRWEELGADPVPLAAWAEWQLNAGPLHPFYDGCGRIARSFAAALLVRASWFPPWYDDHASYYRHSDAGIATFIAYVRARVEACMASRQRFSGDAESGATDGIPDVTSGSTPIR